LIVSGPPRHSSTSWLAISWRLTPSYLGNSIQKYPLISIIFIHILAFYSNDRKFRMHFHTLIIKTPGTPSSISFKQPEGASVQ